MAKLLLDCGAEINALTNVNNTALQLGKCKQCEERVVMY